MACSLSGERRRVEEKKEEMGQGDAIKTVSMFNDPVGKFLIIHFTTIYL